MNKRHYEHTLPNIRGSLSNTYNKKGLDVRLSAYQSLFYYYSMDLEDDEIRQMVNEWLEEWLKVRKRE